MGEDNDQLGSASSKALPTEEVQDNDSDSGGSLNPLDLSMILRKIFGYLSVPDLLACSLVSSRWNYDARSVLRDFRQCLARMDGKHPCTDLIALNAEIPRMAVNPFVGLSINVHQYHRISGLCIGTEDSCDLMGGMYDFITNDFQIKYLKVNLGSLNHNLPNKCPAVRLLLAILKRNSGSLQEINFVSIPFDPEFYEPGQLSNVDCCLPNLKVLRFPHGYRMVYSGNFVQDLIMCSPNLEELYLETLADEIDFLPTERLKIVKDFVFKPRIPPDVNFYQRFALAEPKLRQATASYGNLGHLNDGRGCEALKHILLSSYATLEELKIDFVVAMMLTRMGIPPMVRLQALTIGVNIRGIPNTLLLSALRRVNFTRLFPNLTSISFVNQHGLYYEDIRHFFDGEADVGPNPVDVELEDMSEHIQHINLVECIEPQCLQYWPKLFPHIVTLSGSHGETGINRRIPYAQIWKLWPKIQRIDVRDRVNDTAYNLDAEFCGIYKEEAAELQRQTSEFLKAVHIVPVRPSIVCLRELCELRISLHTYTAGSNLFYLSKVTGLVAFRRMPSLKVGFLYDSKVARVALKHLSDYATVTSR